ncbi:MAG: hypothetical protein RIK87_17820 [Fuerstiella sp.]
MRKIATKSWLTALAAVVLIGAACPTTFAIPIIPGVTKIKLQNSGYPGGNGEFGAFLKTGASVNPDYASPSYGNEDFRTFCAEEGESFQPGWEYTVTWFNTATVATGKALSKEAAWLFREFSQLAGSSYIGSIGTASYNSTNADANKLQEAIWWFIGGQTKNGGPAPTAASNQYVQAVQNAAVTIANMSGFGGVRILNIQNSSGVNMQDQLYWDGTGDDQIDPVPEPMSAALWLFALAGGTMVRRRQNRR